MEEPQNQQFEPTRWSVVLSARSGGSDAQQALEELCRAYWAPLYAFARKLGKSPADSEDLVQGFFGVELQKRIFDAADPEKGKMRTFLITAFRRFVRDEGRRQNAQKRGGDADVLSFDANEVESWHVDNEARNDSPDVAFDRRWALIVLERAAHKVRDQAERRGRTAEFDALRPLLTGDSSNVDFTRLADELGTTANNVKVSLHRFRARFAKALREEVADTHGDASDVDDELRHLLSVMRDS